MRKYLLFLLLICSLFCMAQNFNGDWKGSFRSEYSKMIIPVVFHIVDGVCTEEPIATSSSSPNEVEVYMNQSGDEISLYRNMIGNVKKDLFFNGKLEKGKIKGEYFLSDGQSYKIVMSKFGNGKFQSKDAYKIDKEHGIVVY